MFCNNCGASADEGSKFCLKCGNPLPGAGIAAGARPTTVMPAVEAVQVQPAPQDSEKKKKGAGAFFTSPGGIILIVALALLVVGGLAVGIVFAVSGGGDSKVDAATMDAWTEYQSILENDGKELAQIKVDPTALTANQEALKKSQEKLAALQKDLARTGGTDDWRANPGRNPVTTRDIKAAQLDAAMGAYNDYVQKMNEFLGSLIAAVNGNQLINPDVVNSLNSKLAEVQDLASKAKNLAGKFVKGNDQLAASDIDLAVFKASTGIASAVTNSVTAAQAAEQQRLAGEKAAADQAAAAAAAQAAQQQKQQQAQYVTCPLCGGAGTIEGGDGRYTCPFCGGSGRVTSSKAATFNPADWAP
jgi:zinc-ribbon domain